MPSTILETEAGTSPPQMALNTSETEMDDDPVSMSTANNMNRNAERIRNIDMFLRLTNTIVFCNNTIHPQDSIPDGKSVSGQQGQGRGIRLLTPRNHCHLTHSVSCHNYTPALLQPASRETCPKFFNRPKAGSIEPEISTVRQTDSLLHVDCHGL